MTLPIRQNATHKVVLGPFVDVGDGFTPETGVALSTADDAEAILHDNGTVVSISAYTWAAITTADGYYHLTLQSGITSTIGHLTIVVQDDSVCLPVKADFVVIEEAVYDAFYASAADLHTAAISDIESSLVIVKSDLVIITSDTTAIHSDTTIIHSDTIVISSDTAAIHLQTTTIASDLVLVYSDTTAIHSDTTIIASDVVVLDAAISDVESSLVIVKSDLVLIYSDTTAIHSDTTIIASDVVIIDGNTENLSVGAGGISTVPASATVTTGTETLTYTSTQELDGTTHDIADDAGNTEFYYEFNIGVTGVATEILWDGHAESNGDSYTVKCYDWVSAGFKTVGTITANNSTSVITRAFIVTSAMTGTGANAGVVRWQITSADGANFSTDRILVEYTSLPEAGNILHSGIAQAGTSNTITLDTGASSIDDFYNHARIVISSGTASEQERLIVDYVGSTRVAKVAPPWVTTPDSTSVFEVEPGLCHAETGWATIKVGLAAAGASTTITLDSTASAVDDFYNNDLLHIDAGTGEGQTRVITNYVGSTKVATISPAWSTNPDTTSEYIIEEGHPYIPLIYSDTTIIASDIVVLDAAISDVESSLVIVKSDLVVITSDTTAIHSDTTAIHTQTTTIASDVVLIYSDTTAIEAAGGSLSVAQDSKLTKVTSDVVIIGSDVVLIYSDTTAIEAAGGSLSVAQDSKLTKVTSDVVIIGSDVVMIYSDTTAIEAAGGSLSVAQDSKLTKVTSDVVIIGSDVVLIYSDTTAIEAAGGSLSVAQDSKLTKVTSDVVIVGSDVLQIYSDTTIIASDVVIVTSDTTAIHLQTTTIASDIVVIDAAVSDVESSLVIIKSDLVLVYSDTTAIHSDTTIIASDVVVIDAALSDVESSLVIVKSDLVVITSDTTAIHSDTTIIHSDTVVITSDTAVIETAVVTTLPGLIDDLGVKKNTAFSNFEILMVLTSDHVTPATGLTVTAERSIDGGAFAAVAGAIAEVSNGFYQFDALAADTNGDFITWKFSAATADDASVSFKTVA